MKNTLQAINDAAKNNPLELIRLSEESYMSNISSAAKRISDDDDIKIVSIAGPSGSGKTTTAHILCEMLENLGEKTAVVSLDNFYLPKERLPVLPDGSLDIESVNSLDIALMQKCFGEIIKTGKTALPKYNFSNESRSQEAQALDIGERGIVIVEGLHALNPVITELVPRKNIFKLYISVNSPILDNGEPLLSSRQLRLVRRSLRDAAFRGADINETLSLWSGVIEGEIEHLYKYKDTADFMLKTLHLFEPCVFKERFLRMREELSDTAPCREYFLKTCRALERFCSLDEDYVPTNSLIREFLGGGKYNL